MQAHETIQEHTVYGMSLYSHFSVNMLLVFVSHVTWTFFSLLFDCIVMFQLMHLMHSFRHGKITRNKIKVNNSDKNRNIVRNARKWVDLKKKRGEGGREKKIVPTKKKLRVYKQSIIANMSTD